MHVMSLFNKTFFRFAFGFLGIIFLSIMMIFFAHAFTRGEEPIQCAENCAHAK